MSKLRMALGLMLIFLSVIAEGKSLVTFTLPNLTSNHITAMEQDKYGFIWIGTENGLNRFDGWSNLPFFMSQSDTTSLKNNHVADILDDSEGNLWIASGNGLQKYIPGAERFSNVVFPYSIKPSVKSVIQDGPGHLLAVTAGYGVYSIDTQTMQASELNDINDFIGGKYAHIISKDGLNRIWIGTGSGRIVAIDKNLNRLHSDNLPGRISGVASDRFNNVWTATRNGVFRWNASLSKFVPLESVPGGNIYGILANDDGDILYYTLEDGVYRIDTSDYSVHPIEGLDEIKKDGIQCVLQDKQGNLWCGTLSHGLEMLSSTRPLFDFRKLPTTPSVRVECLFENDERNGVGIALSNNQILNLDSNLLVQGQASTSGRITASCRMADGSLLLGYGDGRLTKNSGNTSNLLYQFGNSPIVAIECDKEGNIYAAIDGSGIRYTTDGRNWKSLTDETPMATSQKLGNNWIGSILIDHRGQVWLGHANGIDILLPKENRFIESEIVDKLRSFFIYAIHEAKDKSMWIGTNHGLYHYTPSSGKIEVFGQNEGMTGNIVCGIAQANNGDIWCSTNKGISRLRQNDHKIINYHSGTDLDDYDFKKGKLLRGSNEKIYVAGINGITAFHPDALTDEYPLLAPMLTRIYLNNKQERHPEIIYTDSPDSKTSATVRLKHFQNTFSLEFSTFDYRRPGNVEFEYRIPSLEKEWQLNPFGDNRVTCNYMEPGKYILEVRAIENGQTSPVTKILIVITPPWYLSIWAKALYTLVIILACLAAWFLLNRHRRHKRNEEITEEKFKFLYNFAHELRSPITLMTSPLTALIREETDKDKADTYRMIQRNGYRIINLVNQMLDIRRIEKGQLKLSFAETDLEEYLERIAEDFRYQADNRGISLSISAPDGEIRAYIDPDNFDKVIVNLISNALKYTPKGGSIDITLNRDTDPEGREYALIEVKDTGIGIPPEVLNHIFERFYQGSKKSIGFGIGLNLSKMLVDMHHGTITAYNREDCSGARFAIRIPLGRKHLSDNEIASEPDTIQLPDRHYAELQEMSVPAEENNHVGANRTYRILVADDDDEIRNYLKKELGESYRVVTATDGKEAYKIALEKEIDLIVSDIRMPDTDGFTLLRQIRSNAELSHIPVILLTSSEDFDTRMTGWEKGADAFLTKPFRIEELKRLCASLISTRIKLKGRFSHGEKIEEAIDKVEIKGNDELMLERITKAINENISNSEFGVEQLADAVGISRVHLHRKMKTLVGLAPREFLKSVRLKQAAEMLKKNNANISQIGYMAGFSSPAQFSDSFRKYFGCSPTEYIARQKEGPRDENAE